jgi:hypothetical protein
VWSHTADLEDSRSLGYCAKRQFAVLRFLCELESLLFDFDGGWGGGSVTVGQFLSPSTHQIVLLKASMDRIQLYRLEEQDRLSRSQRLHKIKRSKRNGEVATDVAPEVLAQEALRVAKNADYLSSHLAFTKRLCDIAEKLRFLPLEDRPNTLQAELSKLNASGTMGGDPLNIVVAKDTDHTRVVRIPTTEGHVFRSKERTPVLLLVETIDEGAERIAAEKRDSLSKESRKEQEQEIDDSLPIKSLARMKVTETTEGTLGPPSDNEEEKAPEPEVNIAFSTSGSDEKVEPTSAQDGNSAENITGSNQDSPLDNVDLNSFSNLATNLAMRDVVEDCALLETPQAKRNVIGSLNDLTYEHSESRDSNSHQRLRLMQTTNTEASLAMAGSQDGMHDIVDGGKRRKCLFVCLYVCVCVCSIWMSVSAMLKRCIILLRSRCFAAFRKSEIRTKYNDTNYTEGCSRGVSD